jgi:hypothetical protein
VAEKAGKKEFSDLGSQRCCSLTQHETKDRKWELTRLTHPPGFEGEDQGSPKALKGRKKREKGKKEKDRKLEERGGRH